MTLPHPLYGWSKDLKVLRWPESILKQWNSNFLKTASSITLGSVPAVRQSLRTPAPFTLYYFDLSYLVLKNFSLFAFLLQIRKNLWFCIPEGGINLILTSNQRFPKFPNISQIIVFTSVAKSWGAVFGVITPGRVLLWSTIFWTGAFLTTLTPSPEDEGVKCLFNKNSLCFFFFLIPLDLTTYDRK